MNDSLLIDLVEKYKFLYDKRDKLFKNKAGRENAWESIAFILEENQEAVETRWNQLRHKYTTEKRSMRCTPSGSGSKPPWVYFKVMGFLDKHVTPRRTFGNVKRVNAADDQPSSSQWDTFNEMIEAPQSEEESEPMEEIEDSIEESPDREEPQGPQETTALKENLNPRSKAASKKTPQQGISKKRKSLSDLGNTIDKTFASIVNYLEKPEDQDPLEAFGKYVSSTLRKIPSELGS